MNALMAASAWENGACFSPQDFPEPLLYGVHQHLSPGTQRSKQCFSTCWVTVFIFWGRCNKYTKIWGGEIADTYSHSSGGQRSEGQAARARLPLKALVGARGGILPAPPGSRWPPGPMAVAASHLCLCLMFVPLYLLHWIQTPLYPVTGLGPLSSSLTSFNLTTSVKSLFPRKVPFTGSRWTPRTVPVPLKHLPQSARGPHTPPTPQLSAPHCRPRRTHLPPWQHGSP